MSEKCQDVTYRPPIVRLRSVGYIIQVHQYPCKDLYLEKSAILVIMCNIMHFSTVSTSQLKHFQLKVIRCAAMSTEC